MEAKAVTSGMTAMSRRSREHRSSKNAGTILEARVSQLDIASTSKNLEVGILSLSDVSERSKDRGESPNLRRSSRLTRLSEKPSAVYVSKVLERRANGAKVHVQGVKNIYAAPSPGKTSAIVGGVEEALRPPASAEAGQGVSNVGRQAHVVKSNGTSALTGSGGTADATGQANGRPLRGRPRGRHANSAKKIAKRAKRLQEVSLTESDGTRILGRRIKVFWRDEDRWFYGVVKAYNRGRRTHKVVYDDKEEEWVKLHEERFKLQVLKGEVFGTEPADGTGIDSKSGSLIGNGSTVKTQEHLNGEMGAISGNVGIRAPLMMSNVRAPPSPVGASENSLEWPGFRSDEEHRESSSRMRKGGFNVEESEDGSPMVCESGDLEDPYAIDHTSISDSLVMFMRSKQSLAESSKGAAASGGVASSEPAALGAKATIEVLLSVEVHLSSEAKDSVEVSDVALASSEASDVIPDPVSCEGCTIEERGGGEGMLCEVGKGAVDSESTGNTESGDLDPTNESSRQNKTEVLGSSADDGLHASVLGNGECGLGEDTTLRNSVSDGVDVVSFRSGDERVGLESREDQAAISTDGVVEFGSTVVKCFVGREAVVYSGEMHAVGTAPIQVLPVELKLSARRWVGASRRDARQVELPWLVRTGRFISWSIGTNLVSIDCSIPGHDVASWILGIDNVWRCVPYITLFVDVILEGDRSRGNGFLASTTRCYGEQSAKGISLRRSVLSAVFSRIPGAPQVTCPSSRLGFAKVVLHGTRTTVGKSNLEVELRQSSSLEFVDELVETNVSSLESPFASSDDMLVQHSCEPKVVDQPCEHNVHAEPFSIAGFPVLEVLDTGDERSEQEGDIVLDDANFSRNGEEDASESYPGAPSSHSPEDDVVRDTNVPVGGGSGGGLTDVQIGSAVEGEDDGGLACYRSWKSVKRGFSQITPEDLGSNGLGKGGMLQGLLDSELGCMALTKRQKVHVESLSSRELENGDEDGEKELSRQEFEMHGVVTTKSVDTAECGSAVPRVNVLKLRKCLTGKGGWRVAGNPCTGDRSAVQFGAGGEPLTPSSIADRKRSFSDYFESNQPESPEGNGHGVSFMEGAHANGHEVSNADGPDEVKVRVKGMWSNCEVSSIQDVPYNPRKRFKHRSTSSGSSDDSYALHFRGDETYPSRNPSGHVYPDSVCQGCMANVLVVQHDKGWRECGATIELQSCRGQGWMLIISVRGEIMYAYKAEQALVTGSTNRHSHAIVWKGGKGWSLEFEDKKQWQAFKELHEECYRRNGKTLSARQIPIPGVRHIEDMAPRSPGCHFVRPYSRYIWMSEHEVEMALGNSRVVYDMDSEDEQWLAQINTERASARGTRTRPLIAEETLERLMDKLEKDAYLHEQQQKGTELDPNDVAAESCTGLATQEVIKVIHGYWVEKRTRKGMPLVRHFQPPAWELYQRQVKSWEQEIAALQLRQPSASIQHLTEEVRKPPLFAFCLRPRGLEAQPKLSKQKSHKKRPWPGSAPRAWVGLGSLDGSLDRRQYYTEPGNRAPAGPRRPGRPRLSEVGRANLAGTFNAIVRARPIPAWGTQSMAYRRSSDKDYEHGRSGKGKKVGRKARRQRLLAAAQESRRKRLLIRDLGSVGSVELQQEPDLAARAARARSIADAARARAQALYAVADAAMHKAVAAVIESEALHAAEHVDKAEVVKIPGAAGDSAVGPTFGSWRRGVPGSALGVSGTKGFGSRQGLESDGEDALLPVASWSHELGAGLGTRLLNTDGEMEAMMGTGSMHVESPPLDVGLVRTRGEGMVTLLSR